MKTYMFDTETGLYLGQEFDTAADVNISEGLTALAPPEYEHGHTPVYDFTLQHWVSVDNGQITSVLEKNKLQHQK